MSGDLAGRTAVVTGAARNIGRAIALELAGRGANVVINAKSSADAAAEAAGAVAALGVKAHVHLADVATPEGAKSLMDAAVQTFGGIDMLVNNAAIRRESRFEDLSWQEWRDTLSVILDGAYLCSHAALASLRKSDCASIVNIGGMSAHAGSAGRAHVVAAKAGLVGLGRALAHDLGEYGITVNCVVPGLIDTVRSGPAKPAHHAVHKTLLGRRGHPEEVASLVGYLCSPQARYITGQAVHVNGGAFLT